LNSPKISHILKTKGSEFKKFVFYPTTVYIYKLIKIEMI